MGENKTAQILISNITNNSIVLNKSMKIASITTDFEVRDMKKIKQLRRQEFSPDDFKLNHLEASVKNKLLDLLREYSDVFSKRIYTIGSNESFTPNFKVNTDNLPSMRAYKVPEKLKPELRRQLNELKETGLIEESNSHISFPLILVKKKNPTGDPLKQSYRICTDFRLLNKNISYQKYSLPIVTELLDKLRGSEMFCTLDLSQSFFQIKLKPEDRDYTTFNSIYGLYKYTVLPQGLSISSGNLQRMCDQMLANISDLNIANFIDDFCVGAQNHSEMLYKLRALFSQMRLFGITIGPSKCEFMVPRVKFLGHMVDKKGIKPIIENVMKIQELPAPTNLKKLRRFLGMSQYYRRFIPKFSEISKPLTELTKKRQTFKWSDEAQQAFEDIKEKLARKPVLIHPNFSRPFILSTDASNFCIAAMLGQRTDPDDGVIHPVSYFSRKLNETEIKLPIMEKELLAIVQAVKTFRNYLIGNRFIIRCDNASLQQIKKLESPTNKVARWLLFLSEFDYEFQKIPGSENQMADLFSRDSLDINTVQVDLPTLEQIKIEQKMDPKLSHIVSKLTQFSTPLKPSEEKYFIRDGMLLHATSFKKASMETEVIDQIVIPEKFKPHILEIAHNSGHFGFKRTYDNIKEFYFWEGMFSDVLHFVNTCIKCFEYKSPNRYKPVPIQRHYVPSRPMEYVSVDLVGKLPITAKGNKYIITFVDHFTRYLKTYAMRTQSAIETADKLYDFICTFGIMENLLSDLGSNMRSELFKEVTKRLGIRKLNTSALAPQSNGINEASHKSLKKSISIFASENKSNWDEALNFYELSYNSKIHPSTGDKPSYLLLGYDIGLPQSILQKEIRPTFETYPDYITKKSTQLQRAYKNVKDNILSVVEKQELYQHSKAEYRDFHIGQLVMLYNPQVDRNTSNPKRRNYSGPFRILEKCNEVNYVISDTLKPHSKPQRVHSRRLLPLQTRKSNLTYNGEKRPSAIELAPPINRPHASFESSDSDSEVDIPLAFLFRQRAKERRSTMEATPLVNRSHDIPETDSSDSEENMPLYLLAQKGRNPQSQQKDLDLESDSTVGYSYSPGQVNKRASQYDLQSNKIGKGQETQSKNDLEIKSRERKEESQESMGQSVLNWMLKNTETNNTGANNSETPGPFRFLNRIADSLEKMSGIQ